MIKRITLNELKKYVKAIVINEMAKQVFTIRNIQASFDDINSKVAKQPWKGGNESFKNRIYVKNTDTGAKIFFDMHGSVADYRQNKPTNIKGALHTFLRDALDGFQNYTPEEFASTFGYDPYEDRAEIRRVFSGVKEAERKAIKLGLNEEDVAEMVSEIDEM